MMPYSSLAAAGTSPMYHASAEPAMQASHSDWGWQRSRTERSHHAGMHAASGGSTCWLVALRASTWAATLRAKALTMPPWIR